MKPASETRKSTPPSASAAAGPRSSATAAIPAIAPATTESMTATTPGIATNPGRAKATSAWRLPIGESPCRRRTCSSRRSTSGQSSPCKRIRVRRAGSSARSSGSGACVARRSHTEWTGRRDVRRWDAATGVRLVHRRPSRLLGGAAVSSQSSRTTRRRPAESYADSPIMGPPLMRQQIPAASERARRSGRPTCESVNGPRRWSSNSTRTACTADGRDNPWGWRGCRREERPRGT
jgi:hypothetical protein